MRSAGLNIADVRDVAQGHVLAWRRGRVGERYILGHRDGNLTMREIVATRRGGGRAPTAVATGALRRRAGLGARRRATRSAASAAGRRGPPIAGVRLARRRLWFRSDKAVRELGLPQSSLDDAFRDAVAQFLPTDSALH